AQIFDSAHSLAGIISDILDLSKIEAGKITLESVPFGLRDTLLSAHDGYRSLAEAKGLELALDIDAAVPPTVLGDPVRVRQILTNFLTNALKFTERGGVRIHGSAPQPGMVRIAVSDSGPGIDPDSAHGGLDVLADRLCGARVLMVEDNPVNMMIAVAMLEQWGVDVTQATDGRMALDAVQLAARQGRLFDAVLMDVQMPHMSGHEAARELRKRYDAQALPIIALTA